MSDSPGDEGDVRRAVVLDFLPHGRSDDDRPQYQKSPVAYALSEDDFALYEFVLEPGAHVGIGERVPVESPPESSDVVATHPVAFDDLSSGARSELEYVVHDVVEDQEDRFVSFYNEAGPITLRLHQLNLLPGIGTKLRDGILEERKRSPFESFEDLEARVTGLHDPGDIVAERIMEELQDEELKYKAFATGTADR